MNYLIFGAGTKLVESLIKEISLDDNSKIILVDEELNDNLLKYSSYNNCIVIIGNILNDGFVFVKLDIKIKELFNGIVHYIYNFSQYKEDYNSVINKSPMVKEDQIKYLDKCTIGIKNIVMLCNDYKSKFVQISDITNTNISLQNSYYKYGNIIAEKYLYELGWYIYNSSNTKNKLIYFIYHIKNDEENIGQNIMDLIKSGDRIN